jgi:hypothetical protein
MISYLNLLCEVSDGKQVEFLRAEGTVGHEGCLTPLKCYLHTESSNTLHKNSGSKFFFNYSLQNQPFNFNVNQLSTYSVEHRLPLTFPCRMSKGSIS